MAFLQETPRSLRAYFLIAGIVCSAFGALSLANALALPGKHVVGAIWALVPVTLYGLALLYGGVRFRALIFHNPTRLEQIVYASFAAVGLQLIVGIQSRWDLGVAFLVAGVGALLSLYLLANVRRLAAEAGAVPPPN
jgi:uncharacterized membrane protein